MWDYRARCLRVHDGDTLTLELDLGFGVRTEQNIRLADVNAPELPTPEGKAALAWAEAWVTQAVLADRARAWPLRITTTVTGGSEPNQRRTFVRYIGTVATWDGRSLNEYMTQHLTTP